jgi:hypothetical protein
MEKMSSSSDGLQGGNGAGGIYSVERLLAAVLLTTSGPGALSQWLALVWRPPRPTLKGTQQFEFELIRIVLRHFQQFFQNGSSKKLFLVF